MYKQEAIKILTNYNQPIYGFNTKDITDAITYARTSNLNKENRWMLDAAIKAEQYLNSKYKNNNFNKFLK